MGQRVGSLVGAVGGLLFVLVNAGELGAAALPLRVLGVVAFAAAVGFAVVRGAGPGGPAPSRSALRTYGWSVTAMVVAVVLGAQVLARVLDRPELTPVWVVFVVGAHFFPFARAFGVPLFASLAVVLMAVAVAGAVVALTATPLGVPAATVAAGFVLLGHAAAGAVVERRRTRPAQGGRGAARTQAPGGVAR